MRRIAPASTLLAAVALFAAGCGGSSAMPSGGGGGSSPAASGSTTSQAQPTPSNGEPSHSASGGSGGDKPTSMPPARVRHRCHTSQLTPGIKVRDSAAGHRHASVVLTNVSETTCTVYGFGGMQLYRHGDRVPTNLVRSTEQQPQTNVVRPGDSVYSSIRWSTVSHGDESGGKACQPVATSARVTPPDERDNKAVSWDFGPVCDSGRIVQGPYLGKAATTKHPV